MMTKHCFLFLAAVLALSARPATSADILYPNTGASNPSTGNTGVPVEQGKKGILLTMQCLDSNGVPKNDCWPLATGSPSLSIGGGAPIPCAAGLSPAANACGYAIGAFTAADPNVDTFKIVYNGNFPPNAAIKATTVNATGNAGSTESSCPNPNDPGCTLSFSVGSNTPRTNASAELVFDISGSMSQPTVPAGMVQRIIALKLAADTFIEAYQPKTMLGDKLGVVFFSTAPSSFPGGVPNFASGIDPAALGPIKTQIDAQVPTNTTAIGQGLQLANTNGFAADGGSPNAKWVFLFTDGEQNVAPNVGVVGPQLQIGGAPYSTSAGTMPSPGQIWVCPITAGRQTAPGFALLQSIANGFCGGQNAYISNAVENFAIADLQTYFLQRLATMLQGDKYEISRDIVSTVTATPSVTFLGNRLDRSFEVILSHAAQAERASYKLIAPDGTVVPLQPRFFAGGSVANIDLPVVIGKKRLPTQGQWKIVFAPRTFGNAPDYHLMVVNDNPTIATTFTTLGTDLGTGDPLQVQATVLDNGKPLANATVTVDISGPNFGLGNILSTITAQGSLPDLHGDNPGPAGAQKLLLLYNDPRNAKYFGTSPRPPLKLRFCKPQSDRDYDRDRDRDRDHRVGNWRHRDHDQDDCDCLRTISIDTAAPRLAAASAPATGGVYTATFTNSALEGHYFFTFHASGTSAGNGPFQRTWKVALFVRPKPYGPKTPVLVESIEPNLGVGGGTNYGLIATLRVTPHDKLGNFIGPGYDGAFEFVNGATSFPFTTDNLDGSYEFVRVTTAPGDSTLVLRTLGQAVKTIDLAGAQPGQTL
jgi:hypothetical protein